MEAKESASLETIKEIQGKIKHYEDQRFLAQQKMSIVRQQLEDIDFFSPILDTFMNSMLLHRVQLMKELRGKCSLT